MPRYNDLSPVPQTSPSSRSPVPGWLVLGRRTTEGVCLESLEWAGGAVTITVLRTEPLLIELCLPGFADRPIQVSIDCRMREVAMGIRAPQSIKIRRSELPRG
jgi:sRNA-binding carbon storage regulator CsrA